VLSFRFVNDGGSDERTHSILCTDGHGVLHRITICLWHFDAPLTFFDGVSAEGNASANQTPAPVLDRFALLPVFRNPLALHWRRGSRTVVAVRIVNSSPHARGKG
jgi:hypothetical protein